MNESFSFCTEYKLDKAYLTECYEQSVREKTFIQSYQKSLLFVVVGLVFIIATDLNRYLASFLVGLGIVEALSVRFQKPWWVTRQLLGRSGNSKVELSLDETGIAIHSPYIKHQYCWDEIKHIQQTAKGFILTIADAQQYISASILSEQAIAFMLAKTKDL